ncbi:putative ATPase/DNA-binding SARP family transcriptional activator [Streptomyces sp. B3I7]|uniref:AfsR/SARP family transcriptional regulator n=1 Tax=Streptomyces sp. B3I7 TaxID=3042269 RepID=UPI002789729E|nr:BTAD domain-containing putative transcriptional regulator [Streptomyces sp. B3I7]MDQ0813787.1 putative ATPase/DNA-binding SARP family transcriptional activator [Streptomyces sp. B3I7]
MGPVRYRILGTTQALRPDGTPVPVGGARLRALLTVLALRPGRTVPAGFLVEEVWTDAPPADAPGALQALVGRLRRALGAGAVESADGGYRLAADADDVDLHRFERLTGEGRRALADGDAAKAAAVLDDALALWQGPPLADLPDRTGESARWEARRLDARRARLTAAVALGEAEQYLPELTALCGAHPLDEPLQALRLRALRAVGRPAQALVAYEGVRRLLADRLGTDPGPELRALHAELLAADTGARPGSAPAPTPRGNDRAHAPHEDDRAPGAPAGPAAGNDGGGSRAAVGPDEAGSRAAVGHDGAGSRAPVGHDDSGSRAPVAPHGTTPRNPDDGFAAGGARPGPPGNLRARLTSFVGRDGDIAALRQDLGAALRQDPRSALRQDPGAALRRHPGSAPRRDLGGARLVTLLGPGGAGKTRLSQEAGEAVADAVPDGVWLAELAPVRDPDAVPEAVLTALGARETVLRGAGAEEIRAAADPQRDDPVTRLVEHCARRRMLLILDNCEHVVDAAARLAEELLARCPGLTVLATSREPLGIAGESLRPVEPLPQPYALELLADRGAAARPGFRPEDDPEAAAEICRRLDGLPLAIELAAARLRMLTLRQIADRLDDRFRLLTSGSRTVLPRQQTLRAVVDWSWELLDDEERGVLRRLSVFAGGCDLAAAEAVCGPAALDALGSLVDKSLVVAAPAEAGDGAEMRYRLLETVAEYAGERLDESGERPESERAHLVHYRELARTADPLLRGSGQRAAMGRLQQEYENIRTALRRAVAARAEQDAICLVLSLVWYWQMRDLRMEARNWTSAVMELFPDPFEGPVRPVPDLVDRCTAAAPPFRPDVLDEARRGVHLAHLACMDVDMAAWQTERAQEKLRTIAGTYRPGQPQVCRMPGSLWFFAVLLTSGLDRIREIADATVATCRALGDEWDLAQALETRANIFANRSDWAVDATRDAEEALEIFERLGDAWGAAEALSARGEALERTGAYLRAAADYETAIEHADRLGAHAQVGVLRSRLGAALIEAGRGEEGERLLWRVIEENAGSASEGMPAARMFLSMWLGYTGRPAEGREQLVRLREEFKAVGFPVFDALVHGLDAWLDTLEGRYEEALVRVREALRSAGDRLIQVMAPQMGSTYLVVAALTLAGLDGGIRTDAARCLGAADALLPNGHLLNVAERASRQEAERRLRELLGDQAYEAAYAEGGGLTLEEATALVRRAPAAAGDMGDRDIAGDVGVTGDTGGTGDKDDTGDR